MAKGFMRSFSKMIRAAATGTAKRKPPASSSGVLVVDSDSTDSDDSTSPFWERRAKRSKTASAVDKPSWHVLTTQINTLAGVDENSPLLTLPTKDLLEGVPTKNGDTKVDLDNRLSALLHTTKSTLKPDQKTSKSSLYNPNCETDKVGLNRLTRLAADANMPHAIHGLLPIEIQPITKAFAARVEEGCRHTSRAVEALPPELTELVDDAVNGLVKMKAANEPSLPPDVAYCLLIEVSKQLMALKKAGLKQPGGKQAAPAIGPGSSGASSSSSGVPSRRYQLPATYMLATGKVLCYPCVNEAISKGLMTHSSSPLDSCVHNADAAGTSKGNCKLSPQDRYRYSRL
jgi:hypothetical protein